MLLRYQIVLVSICFVFAVFAGSAPYAAAERAILHEVEQGETLGRIAHLYGTTVGNLASLNGLSDPHSIRAGQVLVVAIEPAFHTVDPGENLWSIAQNYGVTVHALLLFNYLPNPDYVVPGQTLIIPPAGGGEAVPVMALQTWHHRLPLSWPIAERGVITSLFGMRNGSMHKGLDIAAPAGTPVLAAAKGRVTYADWAGTYGMLVMVDHGDGVVTKYAHNSAIAVEVGQMVRSGQHIADVGNTGRSSGPHLHFEVEIQGEVVDPLTLLPPSVRRP